MFAKTLTALAATATLGSFIAVAAPTVSAEAASRHLSGPHTVRLHRPNRVHAFGKARFRHSLFMATRKARRKAIRNWRTKVGDRYGWRFNKWFIARSKQVKCSARSHRVVCHVSARPRPIVRYGYRLRRIAY